MPVDLRFDLLLLLADLGMDALRLAINRIGSSPGSGCNAVSEVPTNTPRRSSRAFGDKPRLNDVVSRRIDGVMGVSEGRNVMGVDKRGSASAETCRFAGAVAGICFDDVLASVAGCGVREEVESNVREALAVLGDLLAVCGALTLRIGGDVRGLFR